MPRLRSEGVTEQADEPGPPESHFKPPPTDEMSIKATLLTIDS